MIVSRLRGLSRFQVSNVTLGLSTQDLDNILDTVNCLQLVGHHILITSGLELRQFSAFSTWLRQEIETQSSDVSTTEAAQKDMNIDYGSTLEYIQGPMNRSQLARFFDLEPGIDKGSQWDLAAEGRSLFELYKKELKVDEREESTGKSLPALDALIRHLHTQCRAVFNNIAETQKRNVRFAYPTYLGVGTPACADMRMLAEVSGYRISLHVSTRLTKPKRSGDVNQFATYVVMGLGQKAREGNVGYMTTLEMRAYLTPSTCLQDCPRDRKRHEYYHKC